jgi:hypothetical protein
MESKEFVEARAVGDDGSISRYTTELAVTSQCKRVAWLCCAVENGGAAQTRGLSLRGGAFKYGTGNV